jgi:LAO/AO transport system kinase
MRRLAALSHFAAEYGERGLREVGGRRAAERRLAEEDPQRTVPELLAALESSRDSR